MITTEEAMLIDKDREQRDIPILLNLLSEATDLRRRADVIRHFKSLYERIATAELYLQKDVSIAKRYFYKAALASYISYRIYKKGIEFGMIDGSNYENPTMGGQIPYCFFWAVLSDNVAFWKKTVIDLEPTSKWENPYALNIGYAILYLVSNDRKAAHEFILKAHTPTLLKTYSKQRGYSFVIKGIIEENPALIEEGILKKLTSYKREYSKTTISWICTEATALAKFSRYFGYDLPSFSNNLINKSLLHLDNQIDYQDAEEEMLMNCLPKEFI